jgi:prophage regulatory protein
MSKRLIRKKVTAARVGYHPVHIMRLAAQGKFPQPVKLGDPEDPRSAVAFVESEVEAWITERIAERDEKGFEPKAVNPRENHRRAKERQLAEASA